MQIYMPYCLARHLALMLRCQCPSVCPFLCDGSALAHYS